MAAPPPPSPAVVSRPAPPRPAAPGRQATAAREAAEAPAAGPSAASPSTAAPRAAASRTPSQGYIGALLAALERHKEYPTQARYRRAEGVALLRFSMRRDGSVSAWRIERTSGDHDLDAAVGQMLRRATPLPPPPADLAGDPIELVVPVRFSLR
jgi:protein TonB